jgi:hypothetical protein
MTFFCFIIMPYMVPGTGTLLQYTRQVREHGSTPEHGDCSVYSGALSEREEIVSTLVYFIV